MSNYTKSTNFATKDNLPTNDPLKIVKGTEIDTEYNNIATAIATKTDNASAAITGGSIAGVTVTSSNVTITGGSITGITDLAVADGGTGASTAANAINNLLPSQTGNASKYLQSDGTNPFWDAISLSTADITGTLGTANGGTGSTSTTFANLTTNVTGTLPVANGGTGVTSSTGSGNNVLSTSPTLVTPVLGTPTSATLTNATGLPLSTGITGLGTGVATALAINTPNIGAMVVNGGALGTPSSGTVNNLTGTASININGQVGSSTPNSGNFTTLTTSSTVIIGNGTVDGVVYLDASKNLVTGSVISFNGIHLTSNRNVSTTYLATDFTTYPNGFILQNSASPATGLFNSIYFKNNGNMQNVFGVVQNASGYGDFVWAGFSGSYAEAMRLTSAGLSVTGTVGATSGFNGTIGAGTTNTGAFTTISSTDGVNLATGISGDVFLVGNAPNRVFINAGATDNYIRSQTGALGLYAAGATTFAGGIQIISGGNVGINVSNPTSKLDVGGTLGVSGAVTLSGGTANGVAFLNASKVLTTGSALTFDGTSLGIGSSSYGDAGTITASIGVAGTTSGGLQLFASSAQEHFIQWGDATSGSGTYAGAIGYSHASDYMRFYVASTEQMRLTSTGLGIGSNLPSQKLHVQSASNAQGLFKTTGAGGGSNRSSVILESPSNTWYINTNGSDLNGSDGALGFYGNSATRMVIDTSGNLSIANGNLVIGTAGKGIDFSADPSAAGMTSELLDDYEEGTWTPTIALATAGTSTTSGAVGKYTKVGNLVTVVGRIAITKGTGTGDISLGGLPFAAVTLIGYQCAAAISTDEFGVVGKIYQILLTSNSTAPNLLAISQINGAAAIASASDFGAGGATIRYAISYQTE